VKLCGLFAVLIVSLLVLSCTKKDTGTMSEDEILGFWRIHYEGLDPVTKQLNNTGYLVIWPNGRYTLDLGLGIIDGEWSMEADRLTLTGKLAAPRDPALHGKILRDVGQVGEERMTLTVATGGLELRATESADKPPRSGQLRFIRPRR
jgi:hypothetical protein